MPNDGPIAIERVKVRSFKNSPEDDNQYFSIYIPAKIVREIEQWETEGVGWKIEGKSARAVLLDSGRLVIDVDLVND